jgi:hypothetical protein
MEGVQMSQRAIVARNHKIRLHRPHGPRQGLYRGERIVLEDLSHGTDRQHRAAARAYDADMDARRTKGRRQTRRQRPPVRRGYQSFEFHPAITLLVLNLVWS